MEKNYDPKKIEEKWYRTWTERGLFHGEAQRGGESYSISIPPPNITGILHMGHALNNTIQDILIRWQRMQGKNTVWMPGTDHAGIATQNVVERALREEGLSREDLGREAFVERVWKWREEYGGTIVNQLKSLGAACDWERERFTMDEGLSNAVTEVFVRLYRKGLVYRANYIINWCPRCHTALSDEESEHEDLRGKLYYIRYPVRTSVASCPSSVAGERKQDEGIPATDNGQRTTDNDYVVVATTRPETLLGDVAVAVNPNDERYRDLPDKTVLLPVLGRELTVIRDEFVDTEFGTGIVKVTPAHDPNDFEIGRRHSLTPVNVMNGDGTINSEGGPYEGMDRFECRKKILADLEEQDLIEKIEDHDHAVGHCYRCHSVVEPRLSLQWFVKMKPLAGPAIEAVKDGRITFVPSRWTKVYLEWMENIRDWCISRQIWWGHRIPVFYCDACGHEWVSEGSPETCPECGASGVRQDEDVLDTWFSSWLWPFSTFGWPEENEDLSFYYPTNDLVTAPEIIFFWVARMIMAGMEFMGDIPFSRVCIHGTVRDDRGRKMSKSLGNSIDPLEIINVFSADALRFSLMMITATGQDVYVSNEKFEIGRNFGTKLWNAARYLELQGKDAAEEIDWDRLTDDDEHIIAKLQEAVADCTRSLELFRFNDAAAALYEFVWHQFCDWYVEHSKEAMLAPDKGSVLRLMHTVLEISLRLLHPIMPFLTEEVWHEMGYGRPDECIMTKDWPDADKDELLRREVDRETVQYVEDKHAMITAVRALRADLGISRSQKLDLHIEQHDVKAGRRLMNDRSLESFLNARIEVDGSAPSGKGTMPSVVCSLGTVYVSLEGVVDIEAESRRLLSELEEVKGHLARIDGKLGNVDFVTKAPPEVVERQRVRKQELLEQSEKLKHLIDCLSEA